MRLQKLFAPDARRAALARLLAAVLATDDFVFLLGNSETMRAAILEQAATELVQLRCRALYVSAEPAPLSLPALLQQILRHPYAAHTSGDELERSHRCLTEKTEDCDRVALLIDRAERLEANALRYIQLTARASPVLRVVFAGDPDIADRPPQSEFLYFRAKPSICIRLPVAAKTKSREAEIMG